MQHWHWLAGRGRAGLVALLSVVACFVLWNLAPGRPVSRGIWVRGGSYWEPMDVLDAAALTPDRFEREYVQAGRPLVIQNDPGARALREAFSLDVLLDKCGGGPPELGRRLVDVLEAFPPAVKQDLSARLEETHQITLSEAISVLRSDGPVKTLRQFFESSGYFKAVETAQDPRFPNAKKDWSHVADYLWPPSIHSWPINLHCPALRDAIAEVYKETPVGFLPTITEPLHPMRIDDFYLFASGDQCRAYHPHRHGKPNHVMMVLLQGEKQLVTWPWEEADNLYPVMSGLIPANDIKEVTPIFLADGFNVDLTRQPDLAKAKGGLHGVAGPGDLLFIPCGLVHTLANLGDMVAIAWIPTNVPDSRIQKLHDCPNQNGKGYENDENEGTDDEDDTDEETPFT